MIFMWDTDAPSGERSNKDIKTFSYQNNVLKFVFKTF